MSASSFAVVGSFGISMAEFWRGFPRPIIPTVFLGVPWECVWILIIPLVAPNLPRKILIVSLLEATTGPLVLWYAAAVRGQSLSNNSVTSLATYFLFTTFLCAAIAYFTSRFVFHFGLRLKKAREIGSYELVSRLGEGGMGEVWVARHRMLARPAAMKLIRPELLGSDWRSRDRAIARFKREAKATAALGSTHTVDIYDFGVTEEGAFFYVMELLDGLSLETVVRRFGPMSPARAVYLLRQVCHSLGEAHTSGLIHRDIKPANIFTCRLGPDRDFVKVLDFGLVKQSDSQETTTQLTADHATAGTPAYMAPEMALGQPDIDSRADIYALGCVAYWLLTGETVFKGETAMATLIAHVQSQPVPPSQRSENYILPALDDLILACLAKDPGQRPQTADDVERRLAGIPAGTWRLDDAREWWLRHQPGTAVSEVEHTPIERVTIAS